MIPLFIPKLIHIREDDELHVNINTGTFQFSPNAMATGNQPSFPIFQSTTYINNQEVDRMSYGLPFIRFNKNERQQFSFTNNTPYFMNLHFHGYNCNAFMDGTSYTAQFGKDTKIGSTLTYNNKTTNNSMFSWYHPHVGLLSAPLIYSGLYGIYEVSDDFSKKLDPFFEYGSNEIILVYSDADLNITGTLNNRRLNDNSWRAFYGLINGQICLQWTLGNIMPFYTHTLKHVSNQNLCKISMLNGTVSFRTVYLGVSDKHKRIHSFYYIQTDCGLRYPSKMTILSIAPAERVTILFDLRDFEDGEAILFFYNFDLSYIFSQLNNVYLNDKKNIVNMFGEPYHCGNQSIPGVQYLSDTFDIKPFLHIFYKKNNRHHEDIQDCLTIIKQTVFGNNYDYIVNLSEKELHKQYVSLLNPFYFYNLPITTDCPTRQIIFTMPSYPDKEITEWVIMQPRVYVDMWNSYEYQQWKKTGSDAFLPSCLFIIRGESDIKNYSSFQNNKLTITIYDSFLPIQTIDLFFPVSNEPLTIKEWVNMVNKMYNNTHISLPNKRYRLLSDVITFEWKHYLYQQYYLWNNTQTYRDSIFIKTVLLKNINHSEYTITFNANYKLLSFFGKSLGSTLPGKNMQMAEQIPLKAYGPVGLVKIFFGMWGLMIFYMLIGMYLGMYIASKINMSLHFGSMLLMKLGMYVGMYSFMAIEMGFTKITITFFCAILIQLFILYACYLKHAPIIYVTLSIIFTTILYFIIHILPRYKRNNDSLQQIQVTEGSKNGFNVLPISNSVSFSIPPNGSYQGIVDGYMNDMFMNFSVKKNTTEKWIFTNLDTNNVHPLHFHLTSGYVDTQSTEMSDCLHTPEFTTLLYSKDTYALGIQQTIPFYLKFSNYSSLDGRIKHLGFFYHCHFMLHHDMNMMGQYYVKNE